VDQVAAFRVCHFGQPDVTQSKQKHQRGDAGGQRAAGGKPGGKTASAPDDPSTRSQSSNDTLPTCQCNIAACYCKLMLHCSRVWHCESDLIIRRSNMPELIKIVRTHMRTHARDLWSGAVKAS